MNDSCWGCHQRKARHGFPAYSNQDLDAQLPRELAGTVVLFLA